MRKKTPLTRSLLAACSIVALTAVMYGCAHDGGDDPAPPPATTPEAPPPTTPEEPEAPPTTPEEPEQPESTAVMLPEDVKYLGDDDLPMPGETTIAAGGSYTSNAVVFSCAAGGDDCVLTVDANGMASSTGGMVTAALTAEAMERAEEAKMAAMRERRDRIIGKDRALEAAATLLDASGTTGMMIVGEDNIVISRASGAMASVTVSAPTRFVPAADPALANGEDWAGSRLMRTVTGATQHLVVYTDIEPPTRIQFYNFDGDALTLSLYDMDDNNAATTEVLTDENTDYVTAMPPLPLAGRMSRGTLDSNFLSPGPAAGGNVVQTFRGTATGAINTGDGSVTAGVSFPGSYNGAAGRYNCAAAAGGNNCVVTISPGGTYTATGTWHFTPQLNATAWRQDAEFMSFGWWLQEPTAPTGTYTFRYYAEGTPFAAPATGTTMAAGSATYSGRAAGQYAIQMIDNTGVIDGMDGEFVAAASLTATFDGTPGANGTISGSITDFTGENGSMSGWSVMLNEQSFAATAGATSVISAGIVSDPTLATFDGATATMGDQTAHGTWTSQFFGQPTPAGSNAYPLGVGGTFQADNEVVSIAGAFGARRP